MLFTVLVCRHHSQVCWLLSPSEACAMPSGIMRTNPQEGVSRSHQLRSSVLLSEVKGILSKRGLPLTPGRQPKAAAIRLCLGIFLDNSEQELKSRVLLPSYLLLLLLLLLSLLLSSLVCT